jgi:hypothetical protein
MKLAPLGYLPRCRFGGRMLGNPLQDLTVTLTESELFLEFLGFDPCELQDVLVHRAIEVIVPILAH